MKGIIAILSTLSKEEKQEFVLQLRRRNRRTDAKNEKLFKLLNAGKTENLDVILYGKPNRNSFHALCKRLQDGLIEYVASKSFEGETSEELEILKLLLASRIFFEKKVFKLAFKTLENAERMAIPLDMYSILNEIYHTKIQYAHLNSTWVLADIITTSEANMRMFQEDFQLNRAYAVIKSKLSTEKGSVKNIVRDTFSEFQIRVNDSLTYRSLYQLMEIMASAAKLQSDFYSVSPFMFDLYDIVNTKSGLKKKHRFYHLSILNVLAITEFRNKRFIESLKFTMEMELELRNDSSKNNRFLEKVTILKALNYNYTGQYEKAINLLSAFRKYSLDIQLLTVMCHFQQDAYSEAYSIIKSLNHSDTWYEKKMGWIWVVKKTFLNYFC